MAHSYCHSHSGPRKIVGFCGWAKAGIGTKQCEHREPTKRPPRPAATPPRNHPRNLSISWGPMEGNLGHDKNVASSPPVEEYPKGEVVFCQKALILLLRTLSTTPSHLRHPSKESPTKFINFAGPDGGELGTTSTCVACGLRPCRILRFAWIHCERSVAIQ